MKQRIRNEKIFSIIIILISLIITSLFDVKSNLLIFSYTFLPLVFNQMLLLNLIKSKMLENEIYIFGIETKNNFSYYIKKYVGLLLTPLIIYYFLNYDYKSINMIWIAILTSLTFLNLFDNSHWKTILETGYIITRKKSIELKSKIEITRQITSEKLEIKLNETLIVIEIKNNEFERFREVIDIINLKNKNNNISE